MSFSENKDIQENDQFDIQPSKIFNIDHHENDENDDTDKMKYLSQEAKAMQNLEDITCELENLIKIQNLLKQPYKNRAFAISKSWSTEFYGYLENVRKLHKYMSTQSMDILKFKSGESTSHKMDVGKINLEFTSTQNGFAKPTAVMNFDLVFLSPTYDKKMQTLMQSNASGNQQDTSSYFEVKNLFNDWTHMTLREDLMQKLQSKLMPGYCQDPDDFSGFEVESESEIILVSQQCWSKITYVYGQLGPEIAFFSRPDPITQQMIPDLDPIKIGIQQFNENISCTSSGEEQILVSPFLGIKQFTHYLSTNPAIMARDNASPGSLTMILINQHASSPRDQIQQLVQPKSNLGLLETATAKRTTLQEFGLGNGSKIAIIHNMAFQNTTNEKFKKMREIYAKLGPVYNLNGEEIFHQQNPDWVEENVIKEELEGEADYFQYENNDNQNHFSSTRHEQGYQALRNKNNQNYRIRERGNHHNDYQQPQNNQFVPDEYKNDPDLYYALQASLGSVNDDIKIEQKLQVEDIDFENSARKTPSTAEHASPFVSKTVSLNSGIGNFDDAPPIEQRRERPEPVRLTQDEQRLLDAQQNRNNRRQQFEAQVARAKLTFQKNEEENSNNAKVHKSKQVKKRLYTTAGSAYYQIQPLTKMAQIKNFSQLSTSLNKLAANIEARGVNDALMKRGEAIEYEDPSSGDAIKKKGQFEVSSEINRRNPLFGENGNSVRQKKESYKIKMVSSKKNKTTRRFYSPTQKRSEQIQQFDEFGYDERSCGGNTQGTKSGSEENKHQGDDKGILDDMEEDLENIEQYEPFAGQKEDIAADLAVTKKNKLGERARLYSSSEVIKEEFPNIPQNQ